MTSVLLVKEIKPGKFNQSAIFKALEDEAKNIANDIELEYTLATATWKTQIKFEKLIQVGPSAIEVFVGTDNEIFRYVDKGTKPHKIYPKHAKALAFPSMFTPKSTPGVLVSGPGYSGGPTVFSQGVNHPGTKARKISQQIAKMYRAKFKRRMEAAIKNGAKNSGYAMN